MAQQPGYGYGGQYPNGVPGTTPPPPPAEAHGQAGPGGRKKRREYAGQAYEFGVGANVQPGQGPASMQEPGAYDGYGAQAQPAYQQPAYGAGYGAPAQEQQFGQPQYGQQPPAVGGYQPPDVGYPPPAQPDMAGITQGVSQMGFSGSPQPQPQQPAQNRPHLNQLYPTDMLNQPFQVSELDLAPPPIVLPPNVRAQLHTRKCMLISIDQCHCFP